MPKYSILNKKQSLELYDAYHSNGITDFAILTGGLVNDDNMASKDGEYYNGWTLTKTLGLKDTVHCITDAGIDNTLPVNTRVLSIRVAIFDSALCTEPPTFTMGFYPQKLTDNALNEELESKYKKNMLFINGESYTYAETGELKELLVFVYEGKKYVRFPIKDDYFFPYNFHQKINTKAHWVEVLPLKWINLKEKKVVVTRYGLISGVSINDNFYLTHHHDRIFTKNIDNFINKVMLADITMQAPSTRLINLNHFVQNNPIAKTIMNKNNLTIEDVELDEENRLVKRRKNWLD